MKHNPGGRIPGNAVFVAACNDLNNIGGQIDAASSLSANQRNTDPNFKMVAWQSGILND